MARLFGAFAPRLKAYLQDRGHADHAAEALVEAVFVSVWRTAESFDPQSTSAEGWLFTVLRNLRRVPSG